MSDIPESQGWPAENEDYDAGDYGEVVVDPVESARLYTEALNKLKTAGF